MYSALGSDRRYSIIKVLHLIESLGRRCEEPGRKPKESLLTVVWDTVNAD